MGLGMKMCPFSSQARPGSRRSIAIVGCNSRAVFFFSKTGLVGALWEKEVV